VSRPAVDVIVPFAGSAQALAEVQAALLALRRAPGDTLTVVDNRPAATPDLPAPAPEIRIVRAPERQSSYFARNRGVEGGSAPWLVFLDADTRPEPGLLDGYLDPAPAGDAGVLAGALLDEDAHDAAPLASRFAAARRPMSQEITVDRAGLGYAQTANCAVLRAAFTAVGGFADEIRSGGDADLCFRIQRAGWRLEARPEARAVHSNRESLAALLRQRARHGSGAAWLDRRYPGTFPSGSRLGLIAWAVQGVPRATRDYRRGSRETARLDLVEIAAGWAFELGRHLPNTTRAGRRRWTPLGRLLR
jgi:GT2 family glycosyltransferase